MSKQIVLSVIFGLCAACGQLSYDAEPTLDETQAALIGCTDPGPDAEFYSLQGPLPGANGSLIKCERLRSESDAGAASEWIGYRVLYRTSTLTHTGAAVSELGLVASGQVFVPTAPASLPSGALVLPARDGTIDRPVIASTHGATGIIANCGPSRRHEHDGAFRHFDAALPGAVVAFPDYVGLGFDHGYRVAEVGYQVHWPNGVKSAPFANITHPFASIESEGRATVDLVRAARELANLPSNPRWFTVGQSQGGHAAIATAEVVARGYGGEMRLLGVVAGAPASELDTSAWWANEFQNAVFGMLAASLPLEWRDVRASNFLSAEGMMAIADVSNRLCFVQSTLLETLTKYSLVPRMFKRDPWSDSVTLAALAANSPGRATIGVPVFVGQVRGDPLIAYQRTDSFVQKARNKNPAKISYCQYKGSVDPGLPALARADNHDAFKQMFGTTAPYYGCTHDGSSTQQSDPVSFVSALYQRSFMP